MLHYEQSKKEKMDLIKKSGVIGIIRGIDGGFFPEFMAAAFAGGLQALEVTANTKDGFVMVAKAAGRVPGGRLLGMGTICTKEDARRAIDSGAAFLVMPHLDPEIIDLGVKHGVPVVAGALTPTEVLRAWQAGAAMVKVFPCGAMGGPSYIRELRGPFDHLPLVPVGGVRHENAADYFAAGAVAVGVGMPLFGADAVTARECGAISENVKKFIRCCPSSCKVV